MVVVVDVEQILPPVVLAGLNLKVNYVVATPGDIAHEGDMEQQDDPVDASQPGIAVFMKRNVLAGLIIFPT